MQKILKISLCFFLSLSCFTANAMSKSQYHKIVNEIVQKVEESSEKKLKVKFKVRKNESIIKDISSFEQHMSGYMEKETINVLDQTTKITIYRTNNNTSTDYRFAYIIIPDEGLTTGHPATIDVDNSGNVWVTFDLKSLLLDDGLKF